MVEDVCEEDYPSSGDFEEDGSNQGHSGTEGDCFSTSAEEEEDSDVYSEVKGEDSVNSADVFRVSSARQESLLQHGLTQLWDRSLFLYIQIHKVLSVTNTLPSPAVFEVLKSESEQLQEILGVPKNVESVIEETKSTMRKLIGNLLELQELMLSKNAETASIVNTKRKDSGAEMDELIVDYKEEIVKRFQLLIPFRSECIEKWDSKTEVASGKFKNKNSTFSSFHISAVKQINQVLSDRERLVRRTQLKRSEYGIIGETEIGVENKRSKIAEENVDERDKKDYYTEIFDDNDFYHQVLREVIERKTANVSDPTELSARWIELQKIRGKSKRKVDTKSSKGRKIRYAVHSKLVNFMAPHDECPITENAYKELLKTLFANAN